MDTCVLLPTVGRAGTNRGQGNINERADMTLSAKRTT